MSTVLTEAPAPWLYFTDANGAPLANGYLYTYIAGTTTLQATYTTSAGTVANANPIRLDAAGRATAFLLPTLYRFDLYDANLVLIRTADNISAVPSAAVVDDVQGTAGELLPAGNVVYLSDGTGGKTAGFWYNAIATANSSSTTPIIGMVPVAIQTNAVGDIRLNGSIAPSSSVTAGQTYYVSSTVAGALQSTAPVSLQRVVGQADTASTIIISANPPPVTAVTLDWAFDFRLTLTSATPVTTADVTAATTIYLTPYTGNRIDLSDVSGNPVRILSPEVSIAVPNTTVQTYDLFAFNNAGVVALETLAWMNDTTRATAVTRTTNGRLLKSGDNTRLYLGSFRTTSVAGQTEDSLLNRFLWNNYNRVIRPMARFESTATWTYQTNTIRQANGAAANQLNFLIGISEDVVTANIAVTVINSGAGNWWAVGVGLDSTTAFAANQPVMQSQFSVGSVVPTTAAYSGLPGIGKHSLTWLETSSTAGTTTWYGTGNPGTLTGAGANSGITGTLRS